MYYKNINRFSTCSAVLVIMLGIILGQLDPPDWFVDPYQFEYSANIVALVHLEDEVVGSENDLMASFINGECRGVVNGLYFPPDEVVLFLVPIFSNNASGDEVTFQYYNAEQDAVGSLVETVEFVPDAIFGSPMDPIIVHIRLDCAQDPDHFNDFEMEYCQGCTDPSAYNWDPDMPVDDGSCYGQWGDSNLDESIDILDVVVLMLIILGDPVSEYQQWALDTNFDETLTVLDVIILLEYILDNN